MALRIQSAAASFVVLSGLVAAVPAYSGGFATLAQTSSAMGNALAGGAASAEDAGAMWFNPGAIPQLGAGWRSAIAGHRIRPSFQYRDAGSSGVFAAQGTGDGGDGGHAVVVPQVFLTKDIGSDLWLGLGFNVPFGLETEYDPGWRGRFVALTSKNRALNLNPALAYKVNKFVSIGFGINLQKFDVELVRDVPGAGESKIEVDDYTLGWNAGIMLKPSDHTRIGFSYRSSMHYDLSGTATFSDLPPANRSVTAQVTLPESASLSVFAELSSRWDVMADVTWTRWSRLQTISIVPDTPLAGPFASLLPPLAFNWSNTVRLGVGSNYKPDGPWKFRAGIAYDPTPTNDATRTPQLPDQDQIFLSFGARYDMKSYGRIDVSYMRIIIRDSRVNVSSPAGTLSGTFKNKADVVSIQHSIAF